MKEREMEMLTLFCGEKHTEVLELYSENLISDSISPSLLERKLMVYSSLYLIQELVNMGPLSENNRDRAVEMLTVANGVIKEQLQVINEQVNEDNLAEVLHWCIVAELTEILTTVGCNENSCYFEEVDLKVRMGNLVRVVDDGFFTSRLHAILCQGHALMVEGSQQEGTQMFLEAILSAQVRPFGSAENPNLRRQLWILGDSWLTSLSMNLHK